MNILNKFRPLRFLCNQRVEIEQVRSYERLPYNRRFGYKDNILTRGLLPRIKENKPYYQLKTYKPKNSWVEKRALLGQNDYIDILGDGSIHPTKLLTHVPQWLRGFRGNEYQMCQRKMKYFGEYFSHMKPEKYYNLRRRIKYLHGYFNSLEQSD